MKLTLLIGVVAQTALGLAYIHPGLLHNAADIKRINGFVTAGVEPQLTSWNKLAAQVNANYVPLATDTICTGASWCAVKNPSLLYRDAYQAYIHAVYWAVTGDTAIGDTAARILDAWSSTWTTLTGDTNQYLLAGLQGYQFANAAELLRGYSGWTGLAATIEMLETIVLPKNVFYTAEHIGWGDSHWANWGLCNLASQFAIGVLSENTTAVNDALDVFLNGNYSEAITHAISFIYAEEGTGKSLGQGQESGRDQGHSTLDFSLLAMLAQQAWNQGVDLFGAEDNRILAGAEYTFKYNLGHDVPFTAYTFLDIEMTEISSASRGSLRPCAELLIAHYQDIKGLDASWTVAYRDAVNAICDGVECGGPDYGTTSGAYDQPGFGTALFRLK
ncbi:chondroitin AC/alginate lyase [Dactylonectria macrodidyma]|uniref:Chondroitin AC/alginate lyase n=1 Tax=Dactylonectria macrodidyma TaxID=307937 RepID=A0A9P9DWE8_9HYPO|nr:chondroitin AC/alginate lyase [Dactylonectria macrodidyma]